MKVTRYILFTLLMLLLILPAIQQYTGFISEKPLNGAIATPTKPELNWKTWFDASFQESYDDYLEQGIGFRPTLIRINNQIAYTLFDTALANSVIIGKNNYLYELNYIRAYEGTDYTGYQAIHEQVAKARFLQDTLASMGKHFLIVLAPGKASFFPEYIPERYKNPKKGPTNYATWVRTLQDLEVNHLDFNRWFVSIKDTSQYPLYSKTGIHWSLYGVALAVDSLLGYMEQVTGRDMVDFGWDGVELSNEPRDTDNDISEGMNLLFPISTGTLAYPRIRIGEAEGRYRPSVIVVGDSYYWNIMGAGYSKRFFSNDYFWFYNQEAHNSAWSAPKQVTALNLREEILQQDFIILLSTEANLFKFPYGFLDKAVEAIKNPSEAERMLPEKREALIREIMEQMRNSAESSEEIRKKAKAKNISFEEMLRLDAEWVFNYKYGQR